MPELAETVLWVTQDVVIEGHSPFGTEIEHHPRTLHILGAGRADALRWAGDQIGFVAAQDRRPLHAHMPSPRRILPRVGATARGDVIEDALVIEAVVGAARFVRMILYTLERFLKT